MNDLTNITTSTGLTMSSREIADLTGKRHDHVIRDIEKMLADINHPKLGAVEPARSSGRALLSRRIDKRRFGGVSLLPPPVS